MPHPVQRQDRPFTLGKLYSDHHRWLRGWLARRLACRHQADDLSQDAFVHLLGSHELLNLEKPRAFLTVIAKRLLFNHYRRQDIERAYLNALASLPEAQVPSEEIRAMALQALTELARILEEEKPQVRQAFILAQLEGLPYAEITAQLGISLATLKRYLTRVAQRFYFAELF